MKKTYRGLEKDIQATKMMIASTFGNVKKCHENTLAKLEDNCRACGCLGKVCPPGCQSL